MSCLGFFMRSNQIGAPKTRVVEEYTTAQARIEVSGQRVSGALRPRQARQSNGRHRAGVSSSSSVVFEGVLDAKTSVGSGIIILSDISVRVGSGQCWI